MPRSAKPSMSGPIRVSDLKDYYWSMSELKQIAKRLGLPAGGPKPMLMSRIESKLRGRSEERRTKHLATLPQRDSDQALHRNTPVKNYKSDAKTRAFFRSQIGPHFHFTYRLNQFRMSKSGLTYGDLVDEWIAENNRRKDPKYKPAIARHGEYNQYIRDYFSDRRNKGKSFQDAAASWNSIKGRRGERRYKSQPTGSERNG
jgi:hypothetical protein